jgi:hypothetical protein
VRWLVIKEPVSVSAHAEKTAGVLVQASSRPLEARTVIE